MKGNTYLPLIKVTLINGCPHTKWLPFAMISASDRRAVSIGGLIEFVQLTSISFRTLNLWRDNVVDFIVLVT